MFLSSISIEFLRLGWITCILPDAVRIFFRSSRFFRTSRITIHRLIQNFDTAECRATVPYFVFIGNSFEIFFVEFIYGRVTVQRGGVGVRIKQIPAGFGKIFS
jgi:hypothetical protein